MRRVGSGQWPSQRAMQSFTAKLHQQALEQTVRGECGRCGAEFLGRFGEELEWFKSHRCKEAA